MTANLAIMLALILALSSSASPENGSRRAPAAVRSERHVVQKRLTAEDVLGDMHTQESGVINENITTANPEYLESKSLLKFLNLLYIIAAALEKSP